MVSENDFAAAEEQRLAEKAARKAARRALRAQMEANDHLATAQCDEQESDVQSPKSEAPSEWSEKAPKRARKEQRGENDGDVPTMAASSQEFCASHNITVTGTGAASFVPIISFAETSFPQAAQALFEKFSQPTAIQSATWPLVLQKRDVIGVAETGSGKTLAFAAPSLLHIQKAEKRGQRGTFPVLVLAPTRELAMQINTVYTELNCKCVCLYGGVPKPPQIQALRQGVNVVVATPGRLMDLVESNECDLGGVSFVVLDEADRMLDVGFEQAIRTIMGQLAEKRQVLFFTATWPTTVRKLAREFLNDPIKVVIGSPEISANTRVTQLVEMIEKPQDKDKRLLQLLKQYGTGKNRIIIFVLYKIDAPRVENLVRRQGWKVAALHGNVSQEKRTSTLKEFKSGAIPLLVATDVAARGLDVDDIEFVINYSMPLTIEDYVHRIGRTARAGKTGTAHTFFAHSSDRNLGFHLARILREAGQEVPAALEKYGPPPPKKVQQVEEPIDASKKVHMKFDSDEE